MLTKDFILAALLFGSMPFWAPTKVYNDYKRALKSDTPYQEFGLNERLGARKANVLTTMVTLSFSLFFYGAIFNKLGLDGVMDMLNTFKGISFLSIIFLGILNQPVVFLQTFILAQKLQKKFPEKITKKQVYKDLLWIFAFQAAFIGYFTYSLIFYREKL